MKKTLKVIREMKEDWKTLFFGMRRHCSSNSPANYEFNKIQNRLIILVCLYMCLDLKE